MPQLDRDGVRSTNEVHGKGDPIILTKATARPRRCGVAVAALADSYQVVTWLHAGHGLSDSPDDLARYSEEATVGDMAASLDKIGARTGDRRPLARRLHVARVQRASARAQCAL